MPTGAQNCPNYPTRLLNDNGITNMTWWRFFAALAAAAYSHITLEASTVETLPTGAEAGTMASVNDATAPAIGSAVVGGGSAFAAVCWNGTQWTVFSI